ncbi:MAG: YfhO family protein [Burkholderiales bacterium]|nr:YfhO family protein [Anaerolineae bacterium]
MQQRFYRSWPLFALLALTLVFFYKLAFTDLILARGDTFAYFYPYWTARSAAFMQGHIPLWSPELFMGVPLLANIQLGTFYPLNWPLSPLATPDAIRISILLHIYLAMSGVYLLARRTLHLRRLPALLAAALYGLGGYVGAHVEQINQLQGLAWMPILFLLLHYAAQRQRWRRYSLLLTGALALQVLCGHTQTVFISLVGLSVYALLMGTWRRRKRAFAALIAAGVGALLLASAQLIPTLELIRLGSRSGGLLPQQAMAFSFNPFVLGRGLLPSYDGQVFGEYVAYIGVIGLALALIGAFGSFGKRRKVGALREAPLPQRLQWGLSSRVVWVALAVIGLLLALGVYNPLYWTLATLPGFNLFRVPARWLALFALAVAMLGGVGLQTLMLRPNRVRWWLMGFIVIVVAGLAAASLLTDRIPEDVIGPAVPTRVTLLAWAAALVVGLALVIGKKLTAGMQGSRDAEKKLITKVQGNEGTKKNFDLEIHGNDGLQKKHYLGLRYIAPVLALAALVELFFAAGVLPYNVLGPPEVVEAQRFTVSQLEAYADAVTPAPPGRLLSITDLLFDPGDRATLEARWRAAGMNDLAVRHAYVATKMQETLAPNLPLTWGLPSIDGFDGGLLPTGYYTDFIALLLPSGEEPPPDGRLREMLAREECRGACIPDMRWLNLTNTRYLITDKVFDLWHEGVAYDTGIELALAPDETTAVRDLPSFEANALNVLYSIDDTATTAALAVFTLGYGGDDFTALSLTGQDEVEVNGLRLERLQIDAAHTPLSVSIQALAPINIHALTLVDTRTGDFVQLTLGTWRRALSSDIKLYENLDVLPRAFVVYDVQIADDATTLELMRDPAFDPSQSIVLAEGQALHTAPAGDSTATITSYEAERIEIRVDAADDGYLLLTDAYYPGWQATVNGQAAAISRADLMFRAVAVPAGESVVVFEFRPAWWPGNLLLGAAAWLLWVVLLVFTPAKSTP